MDELRNLLHPDILQSNPNHLFQIQIFAVMPSKTWNLGRVEQRVEHTFTGGDICVLSSLWSRVSRFLAIKYVKVIGCRDSYNVIFRMPGRVQYLPVEVKGIN